MTTLNTIIEEEKKKARKQFDDSPVSLRIDALERYAHVHGWSQFEGRTIQDEIDTIVTTAMQRAYEAGRTDSLAKIPMLRQWLNEDKITDVNRMVTNEQIRYWLIGEEGD